MITRSDGAWSIIAVVAIAASTFIVLDSRKAAAPRLTILAPHAASKLAEAGINSGAPRADVTVIEFIDFECRFCRQMRSTLLRLRDREAGRIKIVTRHYPNSRIGASFPAALLVECAASRGEFDQAAAAIFSVQDSLRNLSQVTLARRAGMDSVWAAECTRDPAIRARIAADVRAGRSIGLVATPTVVIGNRIVVGEVSLDSLESLVQESLHARK